MLMRAIGLAAMTLITFSVAQVTGQDEGKTAKSHKVWVKAVHQGGSRIVVRGEDHGKDQAIKIVVDGEVMEVDYSDLGIGESRSLELENGKVMALTRSEDGLVLNTGESEILLLDGDHPSDKRVHAFALSGDDDFVFADDLETIGNDEVVISGLGDLDEAVRNKIIKALRESGVEKEIHFSPHGFVGFGGKHLLHMRQPGAYGFFTDEEGTKVKVIMNGDTVWVDEESEETPPH